MGILPEKDRLNELVADLETQLEFHKTASNVAVRAAMEAENQVLSLKDELEQARIEIQSLKDDLYDARRNT